VERRSDLGFRFGGYLTRTSTTVESTKLVGDTSTKLYKPHQYRSGACDPKVIGPLLAPAPWYQPVAPHGRRLPGSGGLVRRFSQQGTPRKGRVAGGDVGRRGP
jgi:hypothetical protein